MMMTMDECEKTQDLSQMRCETGVRSTCTLNTRCAPRNCRGQHRHWCLGGVLVARVVPLVVDAVIGLTLGLIALVVIVVFVVAILH